MKVNDVDDLIVYIFEHIELCVEDIENDDKKTGKECWIRQGRIQAYEDVLELIEHLND